jgi:Family of unknown function (DUF5752)
MTKMELFEFRKAAFLVEIMPFRAASLGQLLTSVTLAPEVSIFYHLHQRIFREPDHLAEYPNDFAAWAHAALGDAVLAERLANLNLFRSAGLAVVRREISVILAERLQGVGDGRRAPAGAELIFCRPRLVEFGTGRRARTPGEFMEVLRTVDSDSIGYHLFAPKAFAERASNDFASWFRGQGYPSLARQLDAFDPYLNSLEDNRAYLLELVEMGARRPDRGEARA